MYHMQLQRGTTRNTCCRAYIPQSNPLADRKQNLNFLWWVTPLSVSSPRSSQEARQRRGTHLRHLRGAHGRRDPMRKAALRAPQRAVDLGRHGPRQGQAGAKTF